MLARPKSPRERAARALCRLAGQSEDIMVKGEPIWRSYLDEVDTVLVAALTAEEWRRIRSLDPPDPE